MENLRVLQVQQHIDIFRKICAQYHINSNELKIFGRIVEGCEYRGETSQC